jgi:capsid protein
MSTFVGGATRAIADAVGNSSEQLAANLAGPCNSSEIIIFLDL